LGNSIEGGVRRKDPIEKFEVTIIEVGKIPGPLRFGLEGLGDEFSGVAATSSVMGSDTSLLALVSRRDEKSGVSVVMGWGLLQ
jgi:hypothetical protein